MLAICRIPCPLRTTIFYFPMEEPIQPYSHSALIGYVTRINYSFLNVLQFDYTVFAVNRKVSAENLFHQTS